MYGLAFLLILNMESLNFFADKENLNYGPLNLLIVVFFLH
jgi:hypothetical protein